MNKRTLVMVLIVAAIVCMQGVLYADVILNQQRNSHQLYPQITKLSDGNLAVVWFHDIWFEGGPYLRVFEPDLTPTTWFDRRVVNDWQRVYGAGFLDASENGYFVVAYSLENEDDSTNIDAYIQKYDNSGESLSDDVLVNEGIDGNQSVVGVIVDDLSQSIFVFWQNIPDDDPYSLRNLYMRRLNFDLEPISDDITLYEDFEEMIGLVKVSKLSSTRLMAVWHHEYDSWSYNEIMGLCFALDGENLEGPFVVNNEVEGDYRYPHITGVSGGGALVVWSEIDGLYECAIMGRRFDPTGQPIDLLDILLSVPDDDEDGFYDLQVGPYAISDDSGYVFSVCWDQDNGNNNGVFSITNRYFDSELMPLSDTLTINEMQINCSSPVGIFTGPTDLAFAWDGYIDENYRDDIIGTIAQIPQTGILADELTIPENSLGSYPNPFNTQTTIQYFLPTDSHVTVEIYDILGRKVKNLVSGIQPAGSHSVTWNADNAASGIYFYHIIVEGFEQIMRMTLLK